jgi:hypothetical protein
MNRAWLIAPLKQSLQREQYIVMLVITKSMNPVKKAHIKP